MACEFDAMGALSTKYNETPDKASRTYDTHRDGFVIAGGGGMVVVESWSMLWRAAHIYAEVVGYGATSDGADMVAPSGEGAVRCMKQAMAGVDTPIDYPELPRHLDSGRRRERTGRHSRSLRRPQPGYLRDQSDDRPLLGAAGVQEAIYSLLMLEHGFIAPSINIEEMDEQAAGLNIVANRPNKR